MDGQVQKVSSKVIRLKIISTFMRSTLFRMVEICSPNASLKGHQVCSLIKRLDKLFGRNLVLQEALEEWRNGRIVECHYNMVKIARQYHELDSILDQKFWSSNGQTYLLNKPTCLTNLLAGPSESDLTCTRESQGDTAHRTCCLTHKLKLH